MAARDHRATRFSGLDQIDTANVSRLELAWSFSTGVVRGHEAAPLVVGGMMYVVTPFPNLVYALDLARSVPWSGSTIPNLRPQRRASRAATS
jgi:glucose dehydrogenase